MAIFEVGETALVPIERTTFSAAGLMERNDLQRLLKAQIHVIAKDCLVIAEEFSEWDESSRRIDLLAVDSDANLVVVELKRTERGGHMELQALRYAAMVSAMTFEDAVRVYGDFLEREGSELDAEQSLLEHLDWDSEAEGQFGGQVRIVLASADFSKELTTSVLWLNEQGLDLQCIRMHPYQDGNRVLLDVEKVVPLKGAEEYQVKLREKVTERRRAQRTGSRTRNYQVTFGGETSEVLPRRRAMLFAVKKLVDAGISPAQMIDAAPLRKGGLFRDADGELSVEEFAEHRVKVTTEQGKPHRPKRWFMDELIYFEGRTYCLSANFGRKVAVIMEAWEEAFRDHGLKFEELEERS